MYPTLLALHSILRWLVLASILFGIVSSAEGLLSKRRYGALDKVSRSLASGLSHTQLLLGLVLYGSVSPITTSFLANGSGGNAQMQFFGLLHPIGMISAVVTITIGAALTKRVPQAHKKFKVTLLWFTISLLLILVSIPWFRPLLRGF